MAARTATVHNLSSDGYNVARGTVAAANLDTFDTGLTNIDGFSATAGTADTVVTLNAATAGVATVNVFVAGAASAGTQTFYWKAWQRPQRI